jgi:hypothetical protein
MNGAACDEGFWEEATATGSSSSSTSPPASITAATEGSAFTRQVAGLRARYAAERSAEIELEQIEEIETLEAIFGEALERITSEEGSLQELCLTLPTEMDGRDKVEVAISTPNGEIPVGVVEALPPLVLRCALPARYPRDEMPMFSLEAAHLTSVELQELREELLRHAADSEGQPLLFL